MFDDPRKTIILISIIICVIAVTVGWYLGHLSKKYFFGKDYKKSETPLGKALSKKQRFIIIGLPLCIALVFVILFNRLSGQKFIDFIKYGFASIIPNLIVMFIMLSLNKEKFLKELGGNYSIVIFYILTMVIPFFGYFVLISLVFSGCQVPFTY